MSVEEPRALARAWQGSQLSVTRGLGDKRGMLTEASVAQQALDFLSQRPVAPASDRGSLSRRGSAA